MTENETSGVPPIKHANKWVSLAIGLAICVILILIAMPPIRRARQENRHQVIIQSLVEIDKAKVRLALDNTLKPGDPCTLQELLDNGKVLDAPPPMFEGGAYTIGPIGADPIFTLLDGQVLKIPGRDVPRRPEA